MTVERLRNRLAKIEGRLAPHGFVVYVEDGESDLDALDRAGVLGSDRRVVVMPRPIADASGMLPLSYLDSSPFDCSEHRRFDI
jgi:hypothetical protein